VTPGWCWKCAISDGFCHRWKAEKRNMH
jgi:hypothetical protein